MDREWRKPPASGRVDGLSESFDRIWSLWLRGQETTPAHIKAAEKAKAYRLIYTHITRGTVTASDVFRATKNYLDQFTSGRETFGCKRPPAFYRLQDPVLLEHVEARTKRGKPAISLDSFKGSTSFAIACAQAASLRLGRGRPEFPNLSEMSGDEAWAEFLQMADDVQRIAVSISQS